MGQGSKAKVAYVRRAEREVADTARGGPAPSTAHRRAHRRPGGLARRRLVAAATVLACAPVAASVLGGAASAATTAPAWTTSHYELNARRSTLYRQGEAAGRAGAQGIVILDFGRPAERRFEDGTVAYGGSFVPLRAVAAGVESFVSGYLRVAPRATRLDVAVGTNNSCGPGQPCGLVVCGCADEPASLVGWGERFAATVEHVDAWTTALRLTHGYSDDVRVIAGDDVEPAYDPAYRNTYDVLRGYAAGAHGSTPAMVDYGSADPHIWSETELCQVAYGFRPDVPMPEIYEPQQAGEWAALARYARYRLRRGLTFFGVLAGGGTPDGPPRAYADLLGAVRRVDAQRSVPWLSTIGPLRRSEAVTQTG